MKLTCPKCGFKFELEQAVRELEQAETHDIAAKLGVHWRLVYEYSDCFRQTEFSNVSLTKRLRIFKSIARLMQTSTFSYRGKRYRTSQHETVKTMTDICNMQKWGFRNHNYLLAILSKTAERLSAEGMTAKEESERETRRRSSSYGGQGRPVHRSLGEGGKEDIGLEKALGRYPKLKDALERFGKE